MRYLFVNTDTQEAVLVESDEPPPDDLLTDGSVLVFRVFRTGRVGQHVDGDFEAMQEDLDFTDVPRGSAEQEEH